jgi:hypothetical protein
MGMGPIRAGSMHVFTQLHFDISDAELISTQRSANTDAEDLVGVLNTLRVLQLRYDLRVRRIIQPNHPSVLGVKHEGRGGRGDEAGVVPVAFSVG